jgi:Tfp pilus assembly protein PilF
LDEGLAELYGTSRFTASSAIVGAPTDRRIVLEHEEPIPLKELFAVDQASPFYHGPKMQLFYAESWALTHYLTFFEGMERGKRLVQFYNSLQGGLDQEKAFEQAFGPVKTVEDNLFKYARHGKMQAWEIKPFAEIPTSTFKLRELPSAELEAELGGLSIWDSRDMANARELIENALKDDPKFALAHENMGFIDFADGKDEDALREFNTAVESDHTRYLSLFYSAMLSPTARSNAPRDEAQFESNLFKILQVNPQFAPVFVQLSLLYARQGDVKKALAAATRATQLEPSRAGYYLLAGRLALQDGRFKDAASVAKYVAERWRGPDHDEALELWSKIPEQQRSTEAPKMDSLPADLKEVEGTVTSVICEKEAQEPTDHKKDEKSGEQKQSKMTLQLRSKDQEMTFHINPDGAQIGFSDILWYGADHFSLCHRVEGMRALVRYKPSSGSNYAGDFTNLEVRVDPVLGSANQRATN